VNNLLTVEHLSKSFIGKNQDKVLLWDDVNFDLKAGETMSICGESGSGKSTLLFALGGLEPVQSGKIIFDEQPIIYGKRSHINDLSYIFQHYQLIEELPVEENIIFPSRVCHNTVYMKFHRDHVIEALHLQNLLHRLPMNLSGGERQRVAIARALLTSPKLLLADEPTGSLDETTGGYVMDLFFHICKALKTSFILVTHNTNFAKKTDKCFYLKQGKLIHAES